MASLSDDPGAEDVRLRHATAVHHAEKCSVCVIIPVFKCKELGGEYVSKLNPFSTIWCVIENIFLAATAEGLACSMRIPLGEEHDIVKTKLKVPPTYMIPVFIGIGYADPNETVLEQNAADLDKQIHFGRWKK